MKSLDKEYLKKVYNQNYCQAIDSWSDNNIRNTDKIILRVCHYLSSNGFQFNDGIKSLDVGCAKGYYSESLRRCGFNSHGFDYSDIAIEIAKQLFPECHFFVMDGFDPELSDKYDLIFMKGFSGTNTHNLDFVVKMCNSYIQSLKKNGWFILAYSSNFSGFERENETVNWDIQEISTVINALRDVTIIDIKYFSHSLIWSYIRQLMNFLGIKRKRFFYLMLRKNN